MAKGMNKMAKALVQAAADKGIKVAIVMEDKRGTHCIATQDEDFLDRAACTLCQEAFDSEDETITQLLHEADKYHYGDDPLS